MTGWSPDGASRWGGRPVAYRVADAVARERIVVSGTLCSVTVRHPLPPVGVRGGTSPGPADPTSPLLDAELDDGTGTITLRWTGRDSVPGVVEGAFVVVEGTALDHHGHLVVLNPLYRFEGLPRQSRAGRPGTR